MDLSDSEKQKLQEKIAKLINTMQMAENFIEGAIKKAGDSANQEDTRALRANLAILKERTNEKIEMCKKRLISSRRRAST